MSTVNLKKAAELSRAAIAAAKAIEFKNVLALSSYTTGNVKDTIVDAVKAQDANLGRATSLVRAAYEIRALVGAANAANGVDRLLTAVALIDEQIARVTAASATDMTADIESDDMAVVERRIERARADTENAEQRRYGGREEVRISLMTTERKEKLAKTIIEMKRDRSGTKDRLTAINFTVEVTLPDDVVATLTAENIL